MGVVLFGCAITGIDEQYTMAMTHNPPAILIIFFRFIFFPASFGNTDDILSFPRIGGKEKEQGDNMKELAFPPLLK
jgi:hypothetical protein